MHALFKNENSVKYKQYEKLVDVLACRRRALLSLAMLMSHVNIDRIATKT